MKVITNPQNMVVSGSADSKRFAVLVPRDKLVLERSDNVFNLFSFESFCLFGEV